MGPLWKQTPISRVLLSISFGPSRLALPPGFSGGAPSDRDAPLLEPSYIHLSKSAVYKPSSRFPEYMIYFEVLVVILKTS